MLPQLFNFEKTEVRVVADEHGNPWFVAKDVCDAIGLTNPSQAAERLEDDEKGLYSVDTPGGTQEMLFASESGLYEIVLGSRTTERTKRFKRWVKREVLPSIRKTGTYTMAPQPSKEIDLPKDYLSALKALVASEEEKQRQALILIEQKPKVEFFDAVAGSKDAIAMGDVAKVLGIPGMGRNNLFKFLRDEKILMADNRPYQEFIDREYFRVIEQKWNEPDGSVKISFKTLVYQKGLDFIRRTVTKAQGKTALTLAPAREVRR